MRIWKVPWLCLLVLVAAAGCTGDGRIAGVRVFTVTPTPSPTSTPTPTPTPTATATPIPTPTPTPLPAEVLSRAERAYRDGDWSAASDDYEQALANSAASEDEISQATLGLGRTYVAAGAYSDAVSLLDGFLGDLAATDPPTDTLSTAAVEGHVLLGDALRNADQPISAAEHYSTVIEAQPLLAPYANEWLGDALADAGDYVTATAAYSSALADAEAASSQVWLLEKIAIGPCRRWGLRGRDGRLRSDPGDCPDPRIPRPDHVPGRHHGACFWGIDRRLRSYAGSDCGLPDRGSGVRRARGLGERR